MVIISVTLFHTVVLVKKTHVSIAVSHFHVGLMVLFVVPEQLAITAATDTRGGLEKFSLLAVMSHAGVAELFVELEPHATHVVEELIALGISLAFAHVITS